MKINFKHPKYVLPLIVLPFLCLFFYLYNSNFGKEERKKEDSNSLQENVADVSDQVKNTELADKLDAYRNQYKEGDGYTAVGELEEEEQKAQSIPDLYNQREKQMLDSIERGIKAKYGGAAKGSPGYKATYPDDQDKAFSEAVLKVNRKAKQEYDAIPSASPEMDPITVFRQQMSLIDSMGKANDPEFKAEQVRQKQLELAEKERKERIKLPVRKSSEAALLFNTVRPEDENDFITAIIDQDISGYSGSRLRIRLLEDLAAGKFIVKKGTYLYAQVSGFSAQRVNLTISSILHGDRILPVKLDIYDTDGMPGLYVPASAFREFTRELGGSSVQGINLQNQAENNSQLVMSMLQKMFQSTSTAVTRLIRQNKAKIKYNTQVYLIDPDELKNQQRNY
ncbi:conjugative transposon protein TraM [Pedobacter sp. P351]|uniref:conjugative transposon protein TraM n=1 Tax=Pedobacter superstes TaxID=3133441 RepID=UPI0030B6FE5B